jgi:phage FluMu protein Com
MPMVFSPTIGAAITAGYWFLWVRCPSCRTINAIDLRTPTDEVGCIETKEEFDIITIRHEPVAQLFMS